MSRCRSCQAEIIWAITTNGKRMPLDAEPVEMRSQFDLHAQGMFRLEYADRQPSVAEAAPPTAIALAYTPIYRSHFATCPNADQHRKAT